MNSHTASLPAGPVPGAGEQLVADFLVATRLAPEAKTRLFVIIELSMVAPMLTATDLATRMPLPLRTAQRWWSSARDTLGFDPAALHDRLRPYPNVLGAVLRLAGEFETAEDDEEDE